METNDQKPKDNKTFWIAPHCGGGTLDENEPCYFCHETMGECARINSDSIKEGDGQYCGGSGFWCSHCGRFWAQDSCGEALDDPYSSDGEKCKRIDNTLHCYCGGKLYDPPLPEHKYDGLGQPS